MLQRVDLAFIVRPRHFVEQLIDVTKLSTLPIIQETDIEVFSEEIERRANLDLFNKEEFEVPDSSIWPTEPSSKLFVESSLWTTKYGGEQPFGFGEKQRIVQTMEFWQKAKTFAEEAAKKTQTLTSPAKIADIVSETAKRSKEFAAEASKKADEIRAVADQSIKSLADQIPTSLSLLNSPSPPPQSEKHSLLELQTFGITDDLREFVQGLTSSTFLNFPVQDDSPISDVPTVSNVRQDLTEWQQKHASIVLTTVQQISRLRYELCPRHMKDAKFWRIYFTLVSTHVAPYEKQYMEEVKLREEQNKDDKSKETSIDGDPHVPGVTITKQKSLTSASSTAEQDLDSFLLGDLEDGDGGPDDGEEAFDDDFDKIGNSDVEDEQKL
ncbi:hypothetical protein Vadar_025714 [Vaccinium darrowii]|uniref:Uncharacterized protein n=1 Tax=Vaccinium darrowii TaxID=229202 RepID=A0ACB7XKC2_9ERIC|nr:hypothetical protein Vadar_025714 [Vaccinium darrowii]